MGSAGIAAIIARWGFWVLLAYGVITGEMRRTGLLVVSALWLCGYVASGFLAPSGDFLFTAFVAALDVALVLMIFKGDVRLLP